MKSTMFINDITVIDHAYIDRNGDVRGNTVRLNALVSGEVDEHEQVVIDFSKCKKQIKAWVDDNRSGPDHKLIVYSGISNADVSFETDGSCEVDTPLLNIRGQKNVILVSGCLDDYLSAHLSDHLSALHGMPITVKCTLDMKFMEVGHVHKSFHYVHGLKNSSSYGCQNIAHGHHSFIAFDLDRSKYRADEKFTALSAHADFAMQLLTEIANDLNNAVFINGNDAMLSVDENGNVIDLAYTSQRGDFSMTLKPGAKVIVFDTDTTIENIVEYVYKTYASRLVNAGIKTLYVSEGLCKGAVKEIQ